jgi:hypothetical protein
MPVLRACLSILWVGSICCPDSALLQLQQPSAGPPPQTKEPSAPAQPRPAPAFSFGLEDGTSVSLTLGRELSSAKESAGNRVDFLVEEDVKVNGIVVIPKGGTAWGTIVEAKPRRRLGRAGKIDVRIDEARLADGERVTLRASQEAKGKGRSGAMTVGIVATGVLFFPAAPVFLFMHGKDVVIAKGTPVTAYVDGNTALDEAKFRNPPPPSTSPATP